MGAAGIKSILHGVDRVMPTKREARASRNGLWCSRHLGYTLWRVRVYTDDTESVLHSLSNFLPSPRYLKLRHIPMLALPHVYAAQNSHI